MTKHAAIDDVDHPQDESASVYDLTFAATFLANVALMSAVSLLFRYSDFVQDAGGNELHLGWIVGIGMVGGIASRFVQGVGIDRIGTRAVWLFSLLLFMVGSCWHTQIESVTSPSVYMARIVLASGVAGSLGSWLTFASLRAPPNRVAEVIGVVGSSGFIGMAIGPTIGDWLFSGGEVTSAAVDRMFWVAAGLAGLSLLCAWFATREQVRPVSHESVESPWRLLSRYQPGLLIFVAITMGMAATIPNAFVRPFTQQMHINSIAIYFWIYNLTAFTSRLAFRRASQTIGLSYMTVIGLVAMASSLPLYLLVNSQGWLVVPAIAAGLSHAFLFPAVMTAGTSGFPDANRGLAMNFMFALYDTGLLIGAPIIGLLLWTAEQLGWPPYTVAFLSFCAWVVAVAILFLLFCFKRYNRTPAELKRSDDKAIQAQLDLSVHDV